ncbi:MAG TPA: STAS domain-containing protein [Pirellulales bacterium]
MEDCIDDASLADGIWSVIEQHFTYRVVVECDQLGRFTSAMIAQLLTLNRRIRGHGGTLRLCGLSDDNQETLRQCRIDGFFPRFSDRSQAVLGNRPLQPR